VGLPIWMTEIDVAAANEHVRADDLEVISFPYLHYGLDNLLSGINSWHACDCGH